jgi:hypothetical protein
MNIPVTVLTLSFYGWFLILCGIASVLLIGLKAKTALASGGLSGVICLVLAYLVSQHIAYAAVAGLFVSFALFIVFAWRSSKTLFKIFEMLKETAPKHELNGKGIAFLIISLMAVVSIFVFVLQLLNIPG